MMNRVTARYRKPENEDKSDGSFKFAISLIVATLTVFYRLYIYVNNNPFVSTIVYIIINLAFVMMITTLVFMGIFLFMKAMSLEVKNPIGKEKLESSANSYYLISFIAGISYFIVLLVYCVPEAILNTILYFLNTQDNTFLTILVYITIPYSFGVIARKCDKTYLKDISSSLDPSSIKLLILCLISCSFITSYLLNGNIIIGINDVYSKQSEQIPFEITVAGVQYDNLTVSLSKLDLKNNLTLIDSLRMKSTDDSDIVISSKYLIGNNFDRGRFKYYINCANLTEGYYKLSATTGEESFKSRLLKTDTKSFYLVDKE